MSGQTEILWGEEADTSNQSIWQEVSLGSLLTFGNGKVYPKEDGLVPIYGGNGILGYTSKSNYDGESIIIGRVGAYCGSVYFEKGPIWVSFELQNQPGTFVVLLDWRRFFSFRPLLGSS